MGRIQTIVVITGLKGGQDMCTSAKWMTLLLVLAITGCAGNLRWNGDSVIVRAHGHQ